MKRYEMIKPIPPFKVWDPQTRALMPECGRRVLYDQYWSRRQTEGAIEIIPTATAPVTTEAAPPITKKAADPVTTDPPDPVATDGIAHGPDGPPEEFKKKSKKKAKKKS